MGYFGIPFRNGVPIGLGSVASFGAQQFDPSSLFIGGTAGTWYDPSDPTTLFTTSTGTTPCAVPGSGSQVLVGLMLDKSQGAPGALGAELVTTYYSGGAYNNWNSLILSGTTLTSSGGPSNGYTARINVTAGLTYQVRLPATLVPSAGSWEITVNWSANGTSFSGTVRSVSISTTSFFFVPPATAVSCEITINRTAASGAGVSDSIGPFTGLSVKQVLGNHAIAFNDTTARPELSARVNLLTYSEQFENGVWSKSNATVTANATASPDGATTADKLVEDTATSFHYTTFLFTPAASTSYTVSVYAKASERTRLRISGSGLSWASQPIAVFDLSAGTVVTTSGAFTSTSITSVGNGWYRCTATGLSNAAPTASQEMVQFVLISSGTTASYTGDGTSGIFIWGADLRPANIGSAIPSYQRIADQYTYDSNGFPSYLRFDGVDDSMYTPASINFSGTDKMSVFAGVRKLSDAAQAVLLETSVGYGANNGAFISQFLGTSAQVGVRGNANNARSYSGFGAPSTDVLAAQLTTAAANSSAAVSVNVDGIFVAGTNDLSAISTGNFGTYPLFIGSRANTSLFFNGHLYSLITAGTQLQSGSITATEQYVAGKTGVQI